MTNRLEYWNPESLRYRFLAETRRLWELELNKEPSITTVQAAMVLNTVYNMTSMEVQGLSFGAQALALSYKIGILGPLPTELDKRQRHVYGYTAWCLYYWIRLIVYAQQLSMVADLSLVSSIIHMLSRLISINRLKPRCQTRGKIQNGTER